MKRTFAEATIRFTATVNLEKDVQGQGSEERQS